MYPMINEGARILEEGVAARPSDIDVIWLYGYGWPIYRGGPMFYADQVGLKHIADRLSYYAKETNDPVAGAVAAAQASRRRRQDLCVAGADRESGLMALNRMRSGMRPKMSSLRTQGPIRCGLTFWRSCDGLFLTSTPGVMGPCVRRDDVWGDGAVIGLQGNQ